MGQATQRIELAVEAASSDHCDLVEKLEVEVCDLDPVRHDHVFNNHLDIRRCLGANLRTCMATTAAVSVPALTEPPPPTL